MEQPQRRSLTNDTLLRMAAVVVIIAGLKAAGAVLLPFLVAVFLAILSAPLVLWMHEKRWPGWIAVMLVVVAMTGALSAFGALLGSSVGEFTEAIPEYQGRVNEISTAMTAWLLQFNINVPAERVVGALDPANAIESLGAALAGLASAVTNTALVLLTLIFVLLEVAGFPAKVRAALHDADDKLHRFAKMAHAVKRYLAIKTGISLVTGLAVAGWLALLGVGSPLLWGLLAFMLNYVPNVGSIIAAVPAVAIAFLQLGVGSAAAVALGYGVVNISLGNLLEPRLMGRRLGLSPLVVFVSLVFWGWVWGPVGMLLSVPLTMVAKIMLEHSEEYRWVSVLLGSAAERIAPEANEANSAATSIAEPESYA